VASGAGPSALWYLTRGTGAVTLVLLTVSVALGVANVRRISVAGAPRFVFDAVHRSVSLLALAFLAVHIVTSVLDPFAAIRPIDAIVPFVSAYRPVWLGLGAVASDLLIAVALTSALRRRFGYRAWRAAHWLAYACWPIALVHGLGTGSDAKTAWLLALTGGCALVVLVAVWVRATAGWPEQAGARLSALAASIVAAVALLVWLPTGPLAPGWAKRAGTPSSQLPTAAAVRVSTSSPAGASASSPVGAVPPASFNAPLTGTVSQSRLGTGLVQVDLHLALAGQALGALDIRIDGQPLGGGGVEMTSSRVTLGTPSDPSQYAGLVTALEGTNIQARVRSTRGSLVLLAQLQINPSSGAVTGTLAAQPAAAREPGEGNE
jgi:Ferric reductase like transmembrane component